MIRAFLVTETHYNISGVAFAESAGRARMIACRSAWDAGYSAKITATKVVRAPQYDGCIPRNWCGSRFFTVEYMTPKGPKV